mgnify:CR=1 FL=1
MTSIGIIGSEGRMGVALAAAISEAGQRSCGVDKGGSYAPLAEALSQKGRAVVLMGQAAPLLAAAIGERVPVHEVASMDDAVKKAQELAQPGDCVLLSPACSSFDMFADYKERGDVFAQAVRDLIGEKAADPARIASPAEAREVKP